MLSQGGSHYLNKIRSNHLIKDVMCSISRDQYHEIRLVDVGCGDCYFLNSIDDLLKTPTSKKCAETTLIGVDHNPEYGKYSNNGVSFITGDILNIDSLFEENFFDYAVCSEVLEHVDETDKLIKGIRKILKPGGILFLTTPNLASYHARISLLLGYTPLAYEVSNEYAAFGKGIFDKLYSKNGTGEPLHHIRLFTYRSLREFLIYHGYKIIIMRGLSYRFPWLWKRIPSLAPITYAVCKKD